MMRNGEVELKAHIRLENGQLISEKNMHRIRAVSTKLCTGVIDSRIDPKTYKETWVVKKELQGFIFREVTHNMGINGHHKTLRDLLIATLSGFGSDHRRVFILPDKNEIGSNNKL